jgi:hypothetical protein
MDIFVPISEEFDDKYKPANAFVIANSILLLASKKLLKYFYFFLDM